MAISLDGSLVKQIDDALDTTEALKNDEGMYKAPRAAFETFFTKALAAILRATGEKSVYTEEARYTLDLRNTERRTDLTRVTDTLIGILESIKTAIAEGYLDSVSDVIHGTVFADFLDMAQHLLDSGYKDAAAVIAGSSLESHLRQLCGKHGVNPDDASGKPKKADRINADLTKAGAYDTSQQKHVTAWLGTRNDAAHGDYGKYTGVIVGNMISSIRHFMATN